MVQFKSAAPGKKQDLLISVQCSVDTKCCSVDTNVCLSVGNVCRWCLLWLVHLYFDVLFVDMSQLLMHKSKKILKDESDRGRGISFVLTEI